MSRWATLLVLMVFAPGAFGQEVLQEIEWGRLPEQQRPEGADVLPPGEGLSFEVLKIVRTDEGPHTVHLATIEEPGIDATRYAVAGRLRHEDVDGVGYMEMWSHFPDGSFFFSRTLGDTGPMQSLQGTSDWREFLLPFTTGDEPMRPSRLVINLVLPGRGAVYVSPLRVVQYREERRVAAWWSPRTGGLIGGFLGSILGCAGAFVGVLLSRGKGLGSIEALTKAAVLIGCGVLACGLAGKALGQPRAVTYPLLLNGFLWTAIPSGLLPVVRRRRKAIELRKMQAMDAS